MNAEPDYAARLHDAIIVDEIGIESGCYGIYRLRCRYQLIFERRGHSLHAVGAEGSVVPFVGGEEVPGEVFLAAAADDDFTFIEKMSVALPLRNYPNIELDGIDLIVQPPASDGAAHQPDEHIRFIAEEIAVAEIDPASVFFALGERDGKDTDQFVRLADEARGHGMRIAIGDFGAGRWTDEQVKAIDPDVVRIDGDWFDKICRDAVTIRLFDSVAGRLREHRSSLMVSGIGSAQQFGIALQAGADLFQGPHLSPPRHVGVAMTDRVSLGERLGQSDKIIPLYG